MSRYPEHDKLAQVKDESQAIGEFLDWLKGDHEGSPNYRICAFHEGTHGEAAVIAEAFSGKETEREFDPSGYFPVTERIDQLLARYFGIDQEKLEAEKQQMLREIRQRA